MRSTLLRDGIVKLAPDNWEEDAVRRFRTRTECLVCKKRTTEGKPFCIDHIHRLPGPASVIAGLATIDAEVKLCAQRRRPPELDSFLVGEVLRALSWHPGTVASLARDVGVDQFTVRRCLEALLESECIELVKTTEHKVGVYGVKEGR